MNDREKLKSLLHHWMEHNHEHAEVYSEWARKASALGNEELSGILIQLAQETETLDKLFQKAITVV
jgi:hypothetical protein